MQAEKNKLHFVNILLKKVIYYARKFYPETLNFYWKVKKATHRSRKINSLMTINANRLTYKD